MAKSEKNVEKIIEMLNSGNSRDEVAIHLGYKNWRSLDMFMRRNNCTWDSVSVPGTPRTKSVHMSDALSSMIEEFCSYKNLSQRHVFETALVEFLERYADKDSLDRLFER